MDYTQMVRDIVWNHCYGRVTGSHNKIVYLGRGSSRAAFTHEDYPGVVCKLPVAKTLYLDEWAYDDEEWELAYGMTQMYFEIYTWENAKHIPIAKQFLNPILDWGYFDNVVYTISPLIKELAYDNLEIKDILWDSDEYCEFELLMSNDFNLSSGDLINNNENYGYNYDDEIVFIDYGFPKTINGMAPEDIAFEYELMQKDKFIYAIENGIGGEMYENN